MIKNLFKGMHLFKIRKRERLLFGTFREGAAAPPHARSVAIDNGRHLRQIQYTKPVAINKRCTPAFQPRFQRQRSLWRGVREQQGGREGATRGAGGSNKGGVREQQGGREGKAEHEHVGNE